MRWRTMRRVSVITGVAQNDCADAWAAVAAGFAPQGTINAEMELATNATLSVSFSQPAAVGDLCSPQQPGGYLGAENQAIRVQMVDAGNYTWGFDDAAPLYRVQVSAVGGQLIGVHLLNPPKVRGALAAQRAGRWSSCCRGRRHWPTASASLKWLAICAKVA